MYDVVCIQRVLTLSRVCMHFWYTQHLAWSQLYKERNILHVSARQHVRSHAAGPSDPASHHQIATIMFVCGHPRHNAQSIIGHINLSIIMFIKFTTSKRLPSSLIGDIIVRGMHHTIKISRNSLGCLSHHTARIRKPIKKDAMLVQKD